MSELNGGIPVDVNQNIEIDAPIEAEPTITLQASVEMGSRASENNAEAWAVGERGGVPVSSTDQTYHNNAKYYAQAAEDAAETASAAYGTNLLAPTYSATNTYAVGDHVIYDGGYYACNTAITTAEAWTAAHWTRLTVGGEASDLKSALNDSFASIDGRDLIQFKKGFYIDTSGSTVDINNEQASSSWAYAVVNCSPGDIFTINGTGGGTPRLWAFIDSSGNRLTVSVTSASASNLILQAPTSAAKLVLNTTSIKPCYKGAPVSFEIYMMQKENSNQTEKQYSENPYPQKNERNISGTTIVLNDDCINGLKMTSTKGLIYPVNIFKQYLTSSPMSSDNSHFTVTIENGGYKIVKDTSNTNSRYTKNMPVTVPFDGYIYVSCDAHSTHKRKDLTRLQLAKQDGTVLTEYASGDGHLMCGAYVHANDSIVIRCYGGAPDTVANTWYYKNIMLSYSPFAKYETNKTIESNYDKTLEIGYLTGTNKSTASTAVGTQYVRFDGVITSPFLPADNEVSGILQTLNSDALTPVSFDDLYNAQQDNLIAISSSGHLCIFMNSAGHTAVEEWARSIGLSLRFVPSTGAYTGSDKLHTFRAGEVIKYESASSVSFFTGSKPKRKILCFGDSVTGMFTDGSGYVGALNQMNHDVDFVNCGFAGERWTDHSNVKDVPFSMNRLADAIATNTYTLQDASPFVDSESADYKPLFAQHLANIKNTDFTQVDMLTIFYGLNDFASNVILNSADDTSASNKQRTNVEDAVKYVISTILTAYPNLTILVISPYWSKILNSDSNTTPNSTGKYLYEYCDVIAGMASDLNMPTINLYHSMGVGIYNYTNFFLDNTHPNYRLSKAIANRINQIIGDYS